MDEPVIVQPKPYHVTVEAGKRYLWCSCGLSKTQPFCDQSHVGTTFRPVLYTATDTRSMLFCGCKHTREQPFCDGSHNNLVDEYITDDRPREVLLAQTDVAPFDEAGKALLDGGCFVRRHDQLQWVTRGGLSMAPIISGSDGAEFIAQSAVKLEVGKSEVFSAGEAEVVLFCLAGEGMVTISGKEFPLRPNGGALIRKGEAFRITGDNNASEPLHLLMTLCPGDTSLDIIDSMPDHFDTRYAERTAIYDESSRKAMADRFYQVLIGEGTGSDEVSQFIGEVPQSKAAPHRHLYEEAIVILSGHGTLWTETLRAPVRAGDLIFLPARQEHSLECESPAGMMLAGHFYPAGEPNINY
ncbi:cupin [Kineobactrum sediminis]|uniref:Cupin n=1 Tax=Kineobactrum sediminis TaxID=1905677 RepID=A0A2N5Y6B0_9GAMM|nr:CDGSH iron-sulfur domain-containing protein [Kineobactrum sediminis]PLW83909.1 cupin [Kineobactrum sediminis]